MMAFACVSVLIAEQLVMGMMSLAAGSYAANGILLRAGSVAAQQESLEGRSKSNMQHSLTEIEVFAMTALAAGSAPLTAGRRCPGNTRCLQTVVQHTSAGSIDYLGLS